MAIGQNLKSLKSTNRSSLLYLLNANGKMSRKDIAKALALTPAAVTKICQELIQEGYIVEVVFDIVVVAAVFDIVVFDL